MLANWKTYSYIYTIVSRSFQTSQLESGLNNIIRLGYCLAYISTTFEMSISMSLWTYNKIRALKRSSPIVLRKEFFINRSDELALSTVLDVTDVNNNKCKIFANCRNLTDGQTSSVWATGVKTSLHLKIKQKKCIKVLEKYAYGNQVWDMHKPFSRDYFHTFMCSCRY